jgi:hypothetical protein
MQMIKALEILAAGTYDANQDYIQDSFFVHTEEAFQTKQDCIGRPCFVGAYQIERRTNK